MTPSEYVELVTHLVAAARDQDALDLAERYSAVMLPRLSVEQFARVSALLESAQLAVDLEAASIAQRPA
jgi:hypothetical protein